MGADHGLEARRREDVERRLPAVQGIGENQARQAEHMIAVQMADEHLLDLVLGDFIVFHPHLGAFATVHQIVGILQAKHLGGGESPVGGGGSIDP